MSKLSDFIGGSLDTIDFAELGGVTKLTDFSSSGTYTIPATGNYLILACGGGYAWNGSFGTRPGGNTTISTTGFRLLSYGANRLNEFRKEGELSIPSFILSAGKLDQSQVSKTIPAGVASPALSDAAMFGILELQSHGVGSNGDYLDGAIGSSVIHRFTAGMVLTVTIGAGGEIYHQGENGKAEIYRIY